MHLLAYWALLSEEMYWVSPACPFSQTWYLLRRSAQRLSRARDTASLPATHIHKMQRNAGNAVGACKAQALGVLINPASERVSTLHVRSARGTSEQSTPTTLRHLRAQRRLFYSHVDGSALLSGDALGLLKSLANGARGDLGVLVPTVGRKE